MRTPAPRRRLRQTSVLALVALPMILTAACGPSSSSTDGCDDTHAASCTTLDSSPTTPAPTPSTLTDATGSTASTLDKIPAGTAIVDVASTPLGTILVDGTGFVLYAFTPDGAGPPTCVDTCATAWPPVTGTGIAVATGVPAAPGQFKLVARPDGTMQLTTNGHPLYRYSGDTKPGETNGQGVGNQWYVVGQDGNPITS